VVERTVLGTAPGMVLAFRTVHHQAEVSSHHKRAVGCKYITLQYIKSYLKWPEYKTGKPLLYTM